MWTNQGTSANDSDSFGLRYGADVAPIARTIVNRAISDWNAVVIDQNVDNDNNPNTNNVFELTLSAADLIQDGLRGQTQITEFTTGLASQGQSGWMVGAPQDAPETGTLGNAFVDLDSVVPGYQVTLRAAVMDANGRLGARSSSPAERIDSLARAARTTALVT